MYDYSCTNGYPPTQKEIGDQIGVLAPSSVHKHLNYLIKHEFIKKNPSKMRTIISRNLAI
ncbi:LexA family protein [Niallia sp. FSL W8-0177]|uniref:LexA family protein n=1 Tax=Niallia sp. FSL W8-0177 TaxID=2954522 RepID=UPI004046DD31